LLFGNCCCVVEDSCLAASKTFQLPKIVTPFILLGSESPDHAKCNFLANDTGAVLKVPV
jgi:hypothetical protein